MKIEIWKDVIGYEGHYQVSSFARVKSIKYTKHRILKQTILANGYLTLTLCINGVNVTNSVHRVLALAFIPNPENKRTINHKNGIKTDNRIGNLEWATYSENCQHSYDNGLSKHMAGERHGISKLKNKDVVKILEMLKVPMTCAHISRHFNVSRTCISKIKRGLHWKHIDRKTLLENCYI